MYCVKEKVAIRKFTTDDITLKVEWINDPKNNKYLHYDLPLEIEKTSKWFERIKDSETRFDGVIEYDNIPVGLIGLLDVDAKNKKAEYYICLGNHDYKGKGIAKIASRLLLEYAFNHLKLEKVYLFTEEDNLSAWNLFEKIGFKREGLLKNDLIYNNRKISRYVYGILKEGFNNDAD